MNTCIYRRKPSARQVGEGRAFKRIGLLRAMGQVNGGAETKKGAKAPFDSDDVAGTSCGECDVERVEGIEPLLASKYEKRVAVQLVVVRDPSINWHYTPIVTVHHGARLMPALCL